MNNKLVGEGASSLVSPRDGVGINPDKPPPLKPQDFDRISDLGGLGGDETPSESSALTLTRRCRRRGDSRIEYVVSAAVRVTTSSSFSCDRRAALRCSRFPLLTYPWRVWTHWYPATSRWPIPITPVDREVRNRGDRPAVPPPG